MIFKESIHGARNYKIFIISTLLLCAGFSFLLVGFSSYSGKNFFFFTDTSNILFIPQGIIMMFYGSLGLVISGYLFLTFFLNLGSGYNEFSKDDEIIRLIRVGFPGKNSCLFFSYNFKKINKVRLSIKQGLNPRCNIILILKDTREIPLYPAQILLNSLETEKKALYLAKFLNLPLETIFS